VLEGIVVVEVVVVVADVVVVAGALDEVVGCTGGTGSTVDVEVVVEVVVVVPGLKRSPTEVCLADGVPPITELSGRPARSSTPVTMPIDTRKTTMMTTGTDQRRGDFEPRPWSGGGAGDARHTPGLASRSGSTAMAGSGKGDTGTAPGLATESTILRTLA